MIRPQNCATYISCGQVVSYTSNDPGTWIRGNNPQGFTGSGAMHEQTVAPKVVLRPNEFIANGLCRVIVIDPIALEAALLLTNA